MKSWPKVKLGKVGVDWNIAQNHSSNPKEVISAHYLPPIHMKGWPKVKLGQVGVGSNIAQNHSSSYRKSYLAIIGPNSHGKLTKYEIRSQVIICFNLVLSTLIWTQNTIGVHI